MILANKLIKHLKEKELTIAFAESVTCGLATQKLSNFKGTSDVLKGSIICYTPEVKKGLLNITNKCIKEFTCESKKVTDELAKNLSGIIKADLCAAITGLASPGGSETINKPVGTIFLSVFFKGKIHHISRIIKGSPLQIREKACLELYRFILKLTSD
ncbi:MAG: nicotinamide-nucleotide amidohydrolase family protein [Bacteroidota bacterium]